MPNLILRIALTGGPGGGKTTFIRTCAQRLFPWHVITVQESATALKSEAASRGVKPQSDSLDFQQQVLIRQIRAEEDALAVAQDCPKPPIVLADRGMFDCAGFVPFPAYEALLQRMALTPSTVLSRYDALIFLRSVAPSGKVALDRFAKSSIDAFAAHVFNVEAALLQYLSSHPNLIVIEPQDNIYGKMRLTEFAITNVAEKLAALCTSTTR